MPPKHIYHNVKSLSNMVDQDYEEYDILIVE